MAKSDREFREMRIAARDAETLEEGRKVVEGYATTFDQPYKLAEWDDVEIWEVVDRSAFDGCDMGDVIMQYDHEGRVFARTRNKTLTAEPDDNGLFITADLGGTEIGRALYEEIAGGYTDRMSFGFTVAKDQRVEETDSDGHTKITRTILEVGKLYDVSAVSLPANPGTSISARTQAWIDGEIEKVRAERRERLELEERRRKIREKAEALTKTEGKE
jgi:HK97 family phage prohead protease